MKNFLSAFLGSLAAIWASVILVVLFGIFMLIVSLVGSADSGVSVKKHSILHIELAGEVTDRPTPRDVLAQLTGRAEIQSIPLDQLLAVIANAADDDNIDGIYLDCRGASAGMAQTQAIVKALNEFKQSGKWIYAYADQMTQGNYVIAAATADSLMLNPIGMLDLHGLSSTTLYFKDLLDKIGVQAQVLKVGTYKSAVEPYMLNEMSDANREQQTLYLGNIWKQVSSMIADGRGVPADSVNSWADNYSYTKPASWMLANKIVDGLVYQHEMMEMMGRATDAKKVGEPRLISVADYFTAAKVETSKHKGDKKQIAVLYAVGDITENGEGGIASERLVPQVFKLAEDDDIDALILRVNSGGGSAYASEQIWEALQQYKQITGNPFYVSMGDVAASGGYYISCGADRIYAEPVTLTGSIGIFGIIPCIEPLLTDKLGVHTATVSTNATQQLSLLEPMSEPQRAAMQAYINRGYDLFTQRVADGRHMTQDSVKVIAEGRVWDGMTASRIGLVDRLGGLDMAIADMAETLEVGEGDYVVKSFPKISYKWWEEILEQAAQQQQVTFYNNLGALTPIYRAAKSLQAIDDPLQCRMEPVIIE